MVILLTYQDRIVISLNLYPSDIIRFFSEGIAGIVSIGGGVTSHISILARSLEIPLVITDKTVLKELPTGTKVLLDAQQGNIYIDPSNDVLENFKSKFHSDSNPSPLKDGHAVTKDGIAIHLNANINLLRDADFAVQLNVGGVGLYRSEFPFLVRSDFPTEEEQYLVYRSLFKIMEGRPVVIRTLDVGGDKIPSYYEYGAEQNPFLGMRSIRFSLKELAIFKQQIRAILRAGYEGDLGIMFPMISSLDEFLDAKAVVASCIHELGQEKAEFNHSPRLGVMIELPAALEILDELAAEADFFSIGTNDLVQYLLAVDRTNESVSHLYQPHHPAVLRALRRIAAAGERHDIPVSVCGDMGRDEQFIDFFLGIGIRSFSVDPHFLLYMAESIQAIDISQAEAISKELLASPTVVDAERILGPVEDEFNTGN